MYMAEGQPGEAFKMFNDNLFKLGPFRTPALLAAAEVFMGLSKYDKARKCVDDVLDHHPDNYKAPYRSKLDYIQEMGTMKRPLEYSRSTDCLQKHQYAVNLGAAYVSADRIDEAKEVLNGVLEDDPDCQDAKDNLATCAFKEGDFSLAEQLIAETEMAMNWQEFFNNMAISQVTDGQFTRRSKPTKMLSSSCRQDAFPLSAPLQS